jgi:hypothetical protein
VSQPVRRMIAAIATWGSTPEERAIAEGTVAD